MTRYARRRRNLRPRLGSLVAGLDGRARQRLARVRVRGDVADARPRPAAGRGRRCAARVRRRTGTRPSIPSSGGWCSRPLVLASALLDPAIFGALLEDGTGGGSLLVVLTASSVGAALSRSRTGRTWPTGAARGRRRARPPDDAPDWASWPPRSALPADCGFALSGFALVLLLGVAGMGVLRRPWPRQSAARGWMALGALAGFTWLRDSAASWPR